MKQPVSINYLKTPEVCGIVKINGIVHDERDMGKFSFLTLRLPDGLLQCVLDHDENYVKLKDESCVCVTGEKLNDSRSPNGVEVHINSLQVLTEPLEDAPNVIKSKNPAGIATDLKYRAVSLRSNRNKMTFKLQDAVARIFREFLANEHFTEIFTPKIVSGGAEGGANIFKIDYFGQKAFLAQSPQFYKQIMVPVYHRVYEIGPVFRAEKHDTPRHLNEYVSVDLEIGFVDSFYDICETEEQMLKYCFRNLATKYGEILKAFSIELPEITKIPTIRFKEAKELVAQRYKRKIKDPYDLEPDEERLISEIFKTDHDSDFVFVTHYPDKKRPFYAMNDPKDAKYTLSFDLLYKGMEITTGGQRIHDYKEQVDKIRRKGLEPAEFESWLMLHKYGCPPHGGLGLGLERFCMMLLGEKNIRQASLFPRDTTRLTP